MDDVEGGKGFTSLETPIYLRFLGSSRFFFCTGFLWIFQQGRAKAPVSRKSPG